MFIYLFYLMSGFISCLPLRLRLKIHFLPAKILSSDKRARSPYMLWVFVAFWDNSPKWNNTWSTGRTVFIICPTFFYLFFFFAKILTVPDSPSRRVNDILSSHILLQHSKYWYLEKNKKHKRKKNPLKLVTRSCTSLLIFFLLLLFMPKLLCLPGRNTYKGTEFSAGASILLITFTTMLCTKYKFFPDSIFR